MFRLSLIAAAALLMACGARTQKPAATGTAPAEHKGRIITIKDTVSGTARVDTVRFGRMRSGEIAVLRVTLKNATSQPIVPVSHRRSCGCVGIEYDPQPVMPGGELPLTLRFDSRGESGWQLKTLDLIFGGTQPPLRIFVEADVK